MATLGQQTIGSIVKLNVNGVATNFIVVHQGLPGTMYDSSCNGTWLLMQDIYESRAWNSSVSNSYSASTIHSYLNSTFLNLLDTDIKNVVKNVKIPYTNGTGNSGSLATGSNGLSAQIFLLSYTEVNFTGKYGNVEGAVLSYFNGATNSKRIAYRNGSAAIWMLRSPNTSSYNCAWRVSASGSSTAGSYNDTVTSSLGVRPALVLPSEINVSSDGSVTLSNGAITGTVIINGVQRELTGAGYINIGGVLRDLSDSQANIGGTLRSTKG